MTKKNSVLTTMSNDEIENKITYANDVIAVIAGMATSEVEGVAEMCAVNSNVINDVFGRNKNATKGVKVEVGTEEASVDVYLIFEYGTPIQTAAQNVQENIKKAIETMTGLHVVKVDVHVQGVSFAKETASLASMQNLSTADLTETVSKEVSKEESKEESKIKTEKSDLKNTSNDEVIEQSSNDSNSEQPQSEENSEETIQE